MAVDQVRMRLVNKVAKHRKRSVSSGIRSWSQLVPSSKLAVAPYREALIGDGIPSTSFGVDDVKAEHARLEELGIKFTQPPIEQGGVWTAVFADTCGNLIQIAQV